MMTIGTTHAFMFIFFMLSFTKKIQAEHGSAQKKEWDVWLITSVSIGSAAILLLITIVCCCCCPLCKFSNSKATDNNRTRRSSSFRFNRPSAPSAPILMDEQLGDPPERIPSLQIEIGDGPMGDIDILTDSLAPYPPAYSTLPTVGHRSITVSAASESSNANIQENSASAGIRRLQRSDTTASEVWYDASTIER